MTSRTDKRNKPNKQPSPANRRLAREKAEAAALDEVQREARQRREHTARLRKLRMEQEADA